ncbi:heme ABC transporter permease [Sansalvadorimonas sp. 2012CJ34-2]|uniref:Heme exporter protein C n=1 Tax=Parendozoicomonas callyspongiae TaxID=2942213 RepID=A0ABT0PLQ1_9GAMM|nr:heme ABC transporter permease [Sansalvadorimonas sp. 2012CJ34-2]MCL6271657.1 heme ABC transporter permease [Sansalvadorimonas sp. 2012CJ34-2]
MASPKWFYEFSGKCLPWVGGLALIGVLTGIIWGLLFTPPDYLQGNSYRIIFLHVPSASLALTVYVSLAISAGIGFIWKIKLADLAAKCLAPIGASFCALALVTGAIWGKPTWGTWWVWDARLTSMLILLFLYLGLIALREAITSQDTAARACAVLSMVGLVNIPIIKFSVDWWNTLHQGATIKVTKGASMAPEMLIPLLISIFAFYLFCLFVFLIRLRTEIVSREQRTSWVRGMLGVRS